MGFWEVGGWEGTVSMCLHNAWGGEERKERLMDTQGY